MSANYSSPTLRSDFKAERTRVLDALRECETLDKSLSGQIEMLSANAKRGGGTVSSLVVRLTEQLISNRNLKLQLVKQLTTLKRDVIEREIKLTTLADESSLAGSGQATSAATLKALQDLLLGPATLFNILEPIKNIAQQAPEPVMAPAQDETIELSDELSVGDTVCNEDGTLWIVTEDGAEPADTHAAETYPNAERPYAITLSGQYVHMVSIDA